MDDSIQRDLEWARSKQTAHAAFPGMVRVNFLRYFRMFPKAMLVVLLLVLVPAALVYVHWGFGILLLAGLGANYVYLRGLKIRLLGGCINPGAIISLDPPLIAAATDLSRSGSEDCPVVKILPHPVAKMTDGEGRMGQRIGTIATYAEGWAEGGTHWNDFDPISTNCATSDQDEIARVVGSITPDRWEPLRVGLRQIKSAEVGLYRVYMTLPKALPDQVLCDRLPDLVANILPHNPEKGCYLAREGIPPKAWSQVQPYAAAIDPSRTLAFIGSSRGNNYGVVLSLDGVCLHAPTVPPMQFRYRDLVGALYGYFKFELTFRNAPRVRFKDKWVDAAPWELETILNWASGLSYCQEQEEGGGTC